MKYFKILLAVFIFGLTVSYSIGQNKFSGQLSHPLNLSKDYSVKQHKTFADTIRVIAIMVQFQKDSSSLTTGDGRFDLSNKYYNPSLQRDTVIDSPPYDSAYFADHLEFLRNYYYKSSKGKCVLNYTMLGNVFTMSKEMKEYSPQKNENFLKAGQLYREAWAKADSLYHFNGFEPAKTAFVIFHAGSGKDIDLASVLGYDPTPYDIPSVYLGLNTLKEFFGQNFNGIQTQSGLYIQNSLIIPSTELREVDALSGKVLLTLGMNGILTGSFGSYLGLPDLFNTQTGKTAIGRFGLMDGQSIFSYNGTFPPEPSAWEKIYLGWVTPVTISAGDFYYKLKTSSLPAEQDSTIFKVLINSKEYFLIENRDRTPFNNGVKMYMRNRIFKDSVSYTKDIAGFISYDITNLHGNLYDVSNFDWSLPGDITDSTYYRGGILIWHIDENVIDANISSNTINNNLSHRGVCVMEAKGAQLIGLTVSTAFGLETGEGTPYDYWYNGYHYVPSNVYKNEFTPASMPNSLSYSLVNNNIYITEFDSTKSVMNFHIRVGNQIKPIAGFPKYIGTPLEFNSAPVAFDLNNDGKDEIFANNGKDIYGFSTDGQPLNGTDGILVHSCGSYPPSIAYIPALNSVRLIGISNSASSSKVGYFGFNNAFQMIDSSFDYFASSISSYPLVMDSLNLILGFNSGNVMRKDLNALILYKMDSTSLPVNSLSKRPQNSFTFGAGDYYAVDGNIRDNDFNVKYSASEILYGGGKFADNYKFGKIDNRIILADVNKDNHQEVIFVAEGKLFAVNSSGVMLDNFPLTVPSGIVSIPVAADINSDGVMDILVVNSLGDVYAYGTNGKIVDGFPFKTGAAVNSSPAFFNYHDTLAFAVYGKDGYLYAYKTLYQYTPQNILWKNINNDKYFSNNNFYGITSAPVVYSEKLPKDRAYNWPNPVYDSKTYIRYYINGSGSGTTVKIVDLAGNLITKLNGTSYSNMDNEVVWDVSSVQSGVYYGIIESTIDGSSEKRVIKIAVVK